MGFGRGGMFDVVFAEVRVVVDVAIAVEEGADYFFVMVGDLKFFVWGNDRSYVVMIFEISVF